MKSRNDGYRSRAAYKLIEMDEKYGLINDGSKVFDLGSAPGSWSQAVLEKHPKCTVVAIDLLEVKYYLIADETDQRSLVSQR